MDGPVDQERAARDVNVVLDRVLPVVALVLTLTAVVSSVHRSQGQGAGMEQLGWSWLLAPALGGLLLLRRHAPAAVLVASVVLVIGYYATGRPAIGLELPLVAAFFSTAQQGRWRAAWVVGVVALAVAYGYRIGVAEQGLLGLLGLDLMTSVVVIAGAIGAGEGMRLHVAERDARLERLRLQQELVEEGLRSSVQAERQALARDVHDVVGHSVAVVATQASVAADALGEAGGAQPAPRDLDAARAAVRVARRTSQEALREMRASVRLLAGEDEQSRLPAPTLDQLEALAARFDGTDLEVVLTRPQQWPQVSAAAGSTAYRVVQEALTNVVRHSTARRVRVTVRPDGDELAVEVVDDGRPRATGEGAGGGTGVRGLRDRVGMLGGRVSAGPEPQGGYAVRARLPLGPGDRS